jgi:hypothetical protein
VHLSADPGKVKRDQQSKKGQNDALGRRNASWFLLPDLRSLPAMRRPTSKSSNMPETDSWQRSGTQLLDPYFSHRLSAKNKSAQAASLLVSLTVRYYWVTFVCRSRGPLNSRSNGRVHLVKLHPPRSKKIRFPVLSSCPAPCQGVDLLTGKSDSSSLPFEEIQILINSPPFRNWSPGTAARVFRTLQNFDRQVAQWRVYEITKYVIEYAANDSVVLGFEPISPFSKRGGRAPVRP